MLDEGTISALEIAARIAAAYEQAMAVYDENGRPTWEAGRVTGLQDAWDLVQDFISEEQDSKKRASRRRRIRQAGELENLR